MTGTELSAALSEVFAVDLRVGDVVAVHFPEGTEELVLGTAAQKNGISAQFSVSNWQRLSGSEIWSSSFPQSEKFVKFVSFWTTRLVNTKALLISNFTTYNPCHSHWR